MKLRNPFKRKSDGDNEWATHWRDLPGALSPQPVTKACKKCGGLFLAYRLAVVPTVTVNVGAKGDVLGVTTRKERYCVGCTPPADITFAIQGEAGDDSPQDTRHFRVGDLYFQEVDADSGEDIYPASMEEYSHIFCGDCGDMSDWTVCGKCVGKAPSKEKKTKKITTRRY